MARIAFLDCTTTVYTSSTLRQSPLGGIQGCTVNLAESLARRGHEVAVFNSIASPREEFGVSWAPMPPHLPHRYDLVVANNDTRLLLKDAEDSGARRVLWLHNPVRLVKSIKTGRWTAALRRRPDAVFLSEYHRRSCPPFMPFRTKHLLQHAIDDIFFVPPRGEVARKRRAVFISQAYRGLKETADFWKNQIHPRAPDAEFHLFCGSSARDVFGAEAAAYESANIHFRTPVPKDDLIAEMRSARLMLYPGHRDETFCLSAVEGMSCGLPLVTKGIGALRERVENGKTGFLPSSDEEMEQDVLRLLNDDKLFNRMSVAARSAVGEMRWESRAEDWDSRFLS